MEVFTHWDAWVSLLTLTLMELVLGIDNIVFLAIMTGRLPRERQPAAQRIGLAAALLTRLLLLFAISWILGLTEPWLHVFGHEVSGRDLILFTGGVFLIFKATREIHDKVEGIGHAADKKRGSVSFGLTIVQIMILDIVFSLDSVITAVGMTKYLPVMVAAMCITVGVMLVSARRVTDFVQRNPTMKMLGLSFLLLVGVMLTVEGTGHHIDKGYIYFAMAFSLAIEVLNMRMRRNIKRPGPADEQPGSADAR